MNQSQRCHQIEGCPGLFVDAFKVFKAKTTDESSAFILTHYHGDHYNGLQRDGKYEGPAKIHCTPVTAALLKSIHGVDQRFIVEHVYGETWAYRKADIVFYDANHCPGAAIVVVQNASGKVQVHTGDMRFHSKMKEYPALKKAAGEGLVDILYLDTTYSHPKHDFQPQDEAVETIASQVHSLLNDQEDTSTLVLLSCYSIGKEKVLWECSQRTNRSIYVNTRKHKMLECIQGHSGVEESSSIIERCTQIQNEACIHVIPMGLAGEMWPYFQPNYNSVATYASKLENVYSRAVAFIPTGWAEATNWNKKNALSRRRVDLDKIQEHENNDRPNRVIDVEVRLISYSEHSTFSELCSFAKFLKPRKVIPTVFSSDSDYLSIERRFKDLIDSKRAKRMFLSSMKMPSEKKRAIERTGLFDPGSKSNGVKGGRSGDILESSNTVVIDCCDSDDETANANMTQRDIDGVATLVSMGFNAHESRKVLKKTAGSVDRAIERLLSSVDFPGGNRECQSSSLPSVDGGREGKGRVGGEKRKNLPPSITNFFGPKAKPKM
jgi:L-ascorbate metabolism protein UlaG (beta-lactamase superfamily)